MPVARTTHRRHFDGSFAIEVLRGERMLLQHLARGALKDHFTPQSTRLGTHIHHIVGRQHHILVVLHHDDRVAYVAQLLERVNQSVVVALMQSDAGLIEDVEHVDQLRANLCGQADTLTLPSREAHRGAVERKVVEPHIEQELEAGADLLQNLGGNLLLLLIQLRLHLLHPVVEFADIHGGQLGDVLIQQAVRERFAVEPLPATLGAGRGTGKLFGPLLCRGRGLLLLEQRDVLGHSVKGGEVVARGANQLALDLDALFAAVEHIVNRLIGQLADRGLERSIILLQQGTDLPENHAVLPLTERHDSPILYGEAAVGDDLIQCHGAHLAQPFAPGTGPLRRVEGEVVGGRLTVRETRHWAHQSAAVVAHLSRLQVEHHQQSVALSHGRSHTALQSAVVLVLHFELVDDHLHIVGAVAVELHSGQCFAHLAIDAHIEIALLAHLLKELLIMPFTPPHQRCQQVNLATRIVVEDEVEDLLFAVLHHLLAREIGVGLAGTCIEQAEEVIDFGSGPHGRAGILVGSLLLNGDNGAKPLNLIHIGSLQVAQEVARVGREGLNIASLSLGIEGIEGQG